MGTLLVSRGLPADHPKSLACLDHPALVREAHEDYISAGADVIETLSFDANRVKLGSIGREEDLERVNRAAVRLAREATSGEYVFVAGSIGPLGALVKPYGSLSLSAVRSHYREQIRILLDEGIDLLMIESMTSLLETVAAVEAARELSPQIPIVALLTFFADGRTRFGESAARAFGELALAGANLVGANCTLGPQETHDVLKSAAASSPVPLAVMPNAGYPTQVAGRSLYLSSPEYVGTFAPAYADLGAVLVGGCCGTTPEHIRAVKAQLGDRRPVPVPSPRMEISVETPAPPRRSNEAGPESSPFRRRLGREFLATAEIEPPRGVATEGAIEAARALEKAGIDALTVAENPNARLRMSAVALAHVLERELGIETIVQVTCRNRNILGIQSELLGASALGIRAILALTGDPATMGDYPQATSVRDVDALGLMRIVRGLNDGVDQSRATIGQPTDFLIGALANPAAPDAEGELARLQAKIEAGAQFFQTQPIFDLEAALRFLSRPEAKKVPMLAAVLPLRNYRQAVFFANEIPGMVIPAHILERMKQAAAAGDPEAEAAEALAIARELAAGLAPHVDGIHVVPGIRLDAAGPILAAARAARPSPPQTGARTETRSSDSRQPS